MRAAILLGVAALGFAPALTRTYVAPLAGHG
jgi:hypothetical protein